jgi:uncharacterized LabA/DUF88 family protein
MASSHENVSMAVFCDFENVALGVRDANYEKFDIKPILERLLLKGSIVVKKAYCDWERYKGFKATMHEANFELIEIPHVRQSGKNSADIRLVVDALDLCYTKSHVNTFVIISGDSDFSPLVSKLRENAKQVIGVGVKQSTSDLLIANCDEFIFYDDLVRESRRAAAKRDARDTQPAPKRAPDDDNRRKEELEVRKSQAIEMAAETFDALVSERGDSGKIWASVLKEAIKRRKPDFSESYYGFRTFGNLLEEAHARGLLQFGRDEKSGAYVYRSSNVAVASAVPHEQAPFGFVAAPDAPTETGAKQEPRRKGRGSRKPAERIASAPVPANVEAEAQAEPVEQALLSEPNEPSAPSELPIQAPAETGAKRETRRKGRTSRKPAEPVLESLPAAAVAPDAPVAYVPQAMPQAEPQAQTESLMVPRAEPQTQAEPPAQPAPAETADAAPKPARKPAARSRRPRKTDVIPENV